MEALNTGEFAPSELAEEVFSHAAAPSAAPGIEHTAESTAECTGDAYWKREVAARLERYRTRRKPRSPRYPSLHLPFDQPDPSATPQSGTSKPSRFQPGLSEAATPGIGTDFDCRIAAFGPPLADDASQAPQPELRIQAVPTQYEFSNVIEFPRSAVVPATFGSELAEPVIDRPRIVEAPEVIPPPPALGGILIETSADPSAGRHSLDEVSPVVISFGRRLLAGLIDAAIVTAALAVFAALFRQLNPDSIPIPILAGGLIVVLAALWSVYKFLLVVYSGCTPGWRAARLHLVRFDGTPVSRRSRRYRVLASFLSALSLGMGYIWCVLDERRFCWHDRITHTYLKTCNPKAQPTTACLPE